MDRTGRQDLRIAVLAGGTSDEREISLASGKNVVHALTEAGYGSVELIDPAAPTFLEHMTGDGWDAAFIALHGIGGEDGRIQHVLEFLGIPYTASSPLASGIAMDKDLSKLLYRRAGLPVAPSVTFGHADMPPLEEIVAVVGEQSFVKPVVNGSSYGISLAKDPSELANAIEVAFEHGEKVMVEKRVFGTECSVAAVGDGETLRALPVVEILVPEQSEFYDLEVKYADPKDLHRIPACLPENVYTQVQEIACRAHEALGLYGISRTDVIVTEDGPVILETNNIPGMTPESLVPDEARHAGIPFSELCAELVDLALKRVGR
ncbi:D-alanine--D-alanine ligase family protein [Collinsella stercoris]|uniref:D-alanine--D-alanine ligase family protein n=1 Tax=Collinsella stercoris TaxID=147206 RepID=UPI00248EFDC7|nr:D-alanine--D-alanine ligase [Collinsella stercoris]